jgi:DNA invertase Pin-like site-specific DNA recombinase
MAKATKKARSDNPQTALTKNRTVDYLRVSTGEQELEKNKADSLRLANHQDLGEVHFTQEQISGKVHFKEALRFKKAQGIKLGRPKGPGRSKLDPFKPEIEALLANGSTQRFIARRYQTTEANLHNWINKQGLPIVRSRQQEV